MVDYKVELLVYRVERVEFRVVSYYWWVLVRLSSYCVFSHAKSLRDY